MSQYYVNGSPVSQAKVGDVETFNVPGYNRIYIVVIKDGRVQFEGPFSVPMAPYTLGPQDVGTYQTYSYELNPDGSRGALISSTSIRITSTTTGGTGSLTDPGGSTTCAAGICGPTPVNTSPTTGSTPGNAVPGPITVNLGGVNVSPTSGGFGAPGTASPAGATFNQVPNGATSSQGTPVGTGFDYEAFIKGPWGIGLLVLLGVVLLGRRR